MLVEEPGAAPGGRHAGPVPLRAAVPDAPGARARGQAPRQHAHADRGRLRPRRLGGDLPARPRRQRDRALRRPAARAVAAAAHGGRARRDLHDRARHERTSCARSRARSREPQADAGVVMGHVHLHVGDVERGLAFYRDVLGFEVMVQPRQRGVRLGRRLPPPPRLQRLARPRRQAAAAAHRRPARVDGAAPRRADRGRRGARARRATPASRRTTTTAASSSAIPWETAVAFIVG